MAAPDSGLAPPAERLAERLEARPTPRRSAAARALHELARVDLAVYEAIARTPTPTVAVNSATVNLPMKFASGRARPDREAAGVPAERHVPMPTSTSFPSGHSASGFAFAGAVSGGTPALAVPLRGLAAAVAYSRVHTRVHYPGDVVVGALVGATIGEATAIGARLLRRGRVRPASA